MAHPPTRGIDVAVEWLLSEGENFFPSANDASSTIPSGTTVVLTSLTAEKINTMKRYASQKNLIGSVVFMADINLVDADGVEVQPNADTKIRIEIPAVKVGGPSPMTGVWA